MHAVKSLPSKFNVKTINVYKEVMITLHLNILSLFSIWWSLFRYHCLLPTFIWPSLHHNFKITQLSYQLKSFKGQYSCSLEAEYWPVDLIVESWWRRALNRNKAFFFVGLCLSLLANCLVQPTSNSHFLWFPRFFSS